MTGSVIVAEQHRVLDVPAASTRGAAIPQHGLHAPTRRHRPISGTTCSWRYRAAADRRYTDLTPARWYIEDYHLIQGADEERYNPAVRRHLKHSGIPVETSKGEWGRGHNEMNIRYAEAIDMADRHSIMKLAMKDIATTQDIGATFMAKPGAGEAGSKLPCPSQPLVG